MSSRGLAIARRVRDAVRVNLARDWRRATPEQRAVAIRSSRYTSASWLFVLCWVYALRLVHEMAQSSSGNTHFLLRPLAVLARRFGFDDDVFYQDVMYLLAFRPSLLSPLSLVAVAYLLWHGWMQTQRASSRLLDLNQAFICAVNLLDWLEHLFHCYGLLGLSSSSSMSQSASFESGENSFCIGKSHASRLLLMAHYLYLNGVNLRGRLQTAAAVLAATFLCESRVVLKEGALEDVTGVFVCFGSLWWIVLISNAVVASFDLMV